MIRYRLRPLVHERSRTDLWAAPLPHGPIIWLGGSGEPVLRVLSGDSGSSDAGYQQPLPTRGMTPAEITGRLHAEIGGLPGDAEEAIARFLADLHAAGVLEAEPGGQR